MNMQIDTGKFKIIREALGVQTDDPDAVVRAALEAKHKIGRWEQLLRHLKGAGKAIAAIAQEVMSDDELDDLLESFIKRKV